MSIIVNARQVTVPRIIARNRTDLSPWVTLEEISIEQGGSTTGVFHAFRQSDYVQVFAMTTHGEFLLVQQYRPVVEEWTLEFPGGLRDSGEDAERTATRELKEETGFAAVETIPLVECHADVGRLCNKFFGFFAVAEQVADAEPGISTLLVGGDDLQAYATTGRLAYAGQIGLLYLAASNPRVRELCRQFGYAAVPWLK